MKRIFLENNYLVIAENDNIAIDTRNLSSNVYVEINGSIYIFYRLTDNFLIETIDFSNILDADGNTYNSVLDFETKIIDKVGKPNSIDVYIQDQTTDIIDYYLRRDIRSLALSGTQTLSSYVVNLVSSVGVNVGNIIRVQEGGRLFQAKILSINANNITIDTPLDYPYTTAATIAESSINMNVDGSVTPVVFSLEPNSNSKWDITRIIISMTHTSAADDSKFGNLTTLTRGIVIRKKDGIYHTIFNAKNNGDIRLRAYDIAYSDKAGAGLYGTSFRRSFAGQEKNGVTIRLDGSKNESFQLIVQDNLTGLSSFRAVIQGHIVED